MLSNLYFEPTFSKITKQQRVLGVQIEILIERCSRIVSEIVRKEESCKSLLNMQLQDLEIVILDISTFYYAVTELYKKLKYICT